MVARCEIVLGGWLVVVKPRAEDIPNWGNSGSEFLNTVIESYLLEKTRNIKWTRLRPYKKGKASINLSLIKSTPGRSWL